MFRKLSTSLLFKEKINNRQLFYLFALALGMIGLTDAIMSYYFPIVVAGVVGSNFGVGLLMGLMNLVALTCDFLFPEIFKKKTWKFFLLAAAILQVGLPAFSFLGVVTSIGTLFLLASAFWNVYFEMMAFSRQNFIINNEKPENFTKDWGILSVVISLMSVIGPIIGSRIVESTVLEAAVTVGSIQIVTILASILVVALSPENHTNHKLQNRSKIKLNILKQMKLWEVLGIRVLPIIILGSVNTIITASVYTVGGLLGEQILGESNLDWLIIFTFTVPAIFASLVLTKFIIKRYKKLLSQLFLILAALPLITLPMLNSNPVSVIIVFFICSFFLSLSWILNEAVFSDLSRRAGDDSLYVNAIERVNDSLGYLLGPIIIGFLADKTDYFWAFAIVGIATIATGLVLVFVTPRKILIPHKTITELEK